MANLITIFKVANKSFCASFFLMLCLSHPVAGEEAKTTPEFNTSQIKHVRSGLPYREKFEQQCGKWTTVCPAKEVIFDVEKVQSATISLQFLEACSPVSIDIEVVDDTNVSVAPGTSIILFM
jgi:hypothetical protein